MIAASQQFTAAQFTAAQLARALGRQLQAVESLLAGAAPAGLTSVDGCIVNTWTWAALPAQLRNELEISAGATALGIGIYILERFLNDASEPCRSRGIPSKIAHPGRKRPAMGQNMDSQ